MNRDYWLDRWVENRTGFHKSGVNPYLERFLPHVAESAGRALVPLCGKTDDMSWLLERGHDVVGVDVSEIAARSFAGEHGLRLTAAAIPPFTVLRSERFAFYVGDFFDITSDLIGTFDLIYDRAALIALPEDLRPAYASKLRTLLKPNGTVLLIAMDYDQRQMEGPPYSVPENEARTLFAGLAMDKLLDVDCLEEEPRFRERGLTWLKERVYRIRHDDA